MRNWLLALTAVRAAILLSMAVAGYTIFSDDGATRILLAAQWAADPFWHAQLSWQPLQFWLVGCGIRLTGLPPAEVALALVFALALAWPWTFAWALPAAMGRTRRKAVVAVAALLPWGLWPGVSGLVEPLMWFLAFAAVGAWRHQRNGVLGLCLVLLTMTRIEGWILAGCLALSLSVRSRRVWPLIVAGAWPLLWHFVLGPGEHAVEMRRHDAAAGYGSDVLFRILLFPSLAFLTAPSWTAFLFRRSGRDALDGMGPLIGFVVLFWVASVPVGLGTALPQRNLVLPLLLMLPVLVNGARPAAIAFVLAWQCWTLSHPAALLREDLAAERNWTASVIRDLRSRLDGAGVMVELTPGSHAYLPRHLVLRGIPAQALWTDQRPGRWRTNPRETWAKFMMYEEGSRDDWPLVNFWRSYKEGENFRRGCTREEIVATLEANDIGVILTARDSKWPHLYGYTRLAESRDHAVFSREDLLPPVLPYTVRQPVVGRRESIRRAWRERRLTPEFRRAIRELLGL